MLFWPCKAPKKREDFIHNHKGRPWGGGEGGGAPLPHRSKPAALSLIAKGVCKKLTIFPLAFVPNLFDANTLQPLDFSVVGSTERILGLEGNLVFRSKSAADSPVPQHDNTENKRSARRLSVGKRWKVPPASATAAGPETIWPDSPDAAAIYQADCNEQKHYQGTFCSPLNTVSVLCHYLVSGALRDRPA